MNLADISTYSPLTVLTTDLYVTHINRGPNGEFLPEAPLNIQPPGSPGGWNAGSARFSPAGDRIAFYEGSYFWIADLVRDPYTNKITSLGSLYRLAHRDDIGSPSDSNATGGYALSGTLDFSPDGTKLVVTVYSDLWLLQLAADGHTLAAKTALTRTVGATEYQPAFSLDGSRVAFAGGVNSYASFIGGYALATTDINLSVLNLVAAKSSSLINSRNKGGAAPPRQNPAWSPDSNYILFAAVGSNSSRKTACGNMNNGELFKIRADGSGTAVNLTNTAPSAGVEGSPHWGW